MGRTAGTGGAPKSIRKVAKDAQAEREGLHSQCLNAIEMLQLRNGQDETIELDAGQEEGLDMDSLQENDERQHPRGEPLSWQDQPNATVRVNLVEDSEEEATSEERLAFLKALIEHTSQATTGLACRPCQIDSTAPQTAKDKRWNRAQLGKQSKGKVHTLRQELTSGFNGVKKAKGIGSSVACPSCPDESYKTAAEWLQHVPVLDPEKLWLEDEEKENEDDGDSYLENL